VNSRTLHPGLVQRGRSRADARVSEWYWKRLSAPARDLRCASSSNCRAGAQIAAYPVSSKIARLLRELTAQAGIPAKAGRVEATLLLAGDPVSFGLCGRETVPEWNGDEALVVC